jgi:hypothetical protein
MHSAKLFISHAFEDKEGFVEPLAHALRDVGYEVWYDKFVLTIGDSLLRKISEGLTQADFGIVVLSKHFFTKKWPQAELDGLFSLETVERKVVLPIWKDVTEVEVKAFSPILASKLAAMASHGVPAVVDEIKRAVETTRTVEKFSAIDNALSRFRSLDQRVSGSKRAQQLARCEEGVQIVRNAITSALASLKNQLETFGESSEAMTFSVAPQKTGNQELTVWCPYRVRLCIRYSQEYNNSLTEAGLCFYLAHSNFGEIDGSSERDVVRRFILRPDFDHTLKLVWRDEERALTTEQLVAFVLNELAEEIDIHHNEAEANKQH